MSYRDRNCKQLTLPSGATCWIRKLVGNDFVTIGNIPAFRGDKADKREPSESEKAAAVKWSLGLEKIIFTHCVSDFTLENEKLKIVDKPLNTAGKGEIEIELLDGEDAAAIVQAVMAFSSMGKGAAGNGQTFRPDEDRHGEPAPPRDNLPMPAEPVP